MSAIDDTYVDQMGNDVIPRIPGYFLHESQAEVRKEPPAVRLFIYVKHFLDFAAALNEGITKAVHGLAAGLAACGAEVTVLCEGKEASRSTAVAGYEIECFQTDCASPSFRLAAGLRRRLQLLQQSKQPVLVILNGIFHPSLYSISRLLRQYGIPYVIAPHDPYSPAIFKKKAHIKWPYWYMLERPMLRGGKAVQVLDLRHAEWLRRLGVFTPIIEVQNGFSIEDVLPEQALQWDNNRPARFCHWGRLDIFNKGIDILLEAFERIAPETDALLQIGGPDDGDMVRLSRLAEPLLRTQRLRLAGPDFSRSCCAILADHDVICLPSRFEGFSLVALEAMLSARVLLVSDNAGIAPHVQASGCGVVVQPDVQSVADGMRELLLRRSEWRDMGLRGRSYVLKQLEWNAIAARALGSYKALAGLPKPESNS